MAVQLVTDGETAAASGPVLTVSGLEVAYGGERPGAARRHLEVREGMAVALLGANGAGKTTTIRAISGLLKLHYGRILSGSVEFDGTDVTKLRANKIVAQGVAQVPEGRMVFAELTVDENLRIGATARKGGVSQEVMERSTRCSRRSIAAATTRPAGCRAASSRWSRSGAG